ncbi:hypothetical protein EDD92_6270 [Streptomyces sp. TLI_185]|nr:hypothetical protein EDD92_6270 [Streptomyces sp. TLI_185]
MGEEGVRDTRRWAFHHGIVAEDRARVHHAAGPGLALCLRAIKPFVGGLE